MTTSFALHTTIQLSQLFTSGSGEGVVVPPQVSPHPVHHHQSGFGSVEKV